MQGKSSRDLQPVEGSEFVEEADLCLVAIGFTHPEHDGVIAGLGLDLDARGQHRRARVRHLARRTCSARATRAWASR